MKREHIDTRLAIILLALAAVLAAGLFMTLGAKGSWAFILSFRGKKLIGMALISYAIAISTVLFQTITTNRILTPAIMGFDALYGLLQTTLVFVLGAAFVSVIDARVMFLAEVAAMVGFSLMLYRFLFSGAVRSLHLLLLVGIVFGLLFRSLSGFLQRLINPGDFVVLQDRMFASFNTIDGSLLAVSFVLIAATSLMVWRIFHTLDVMALGRETAISLGVDHKRITNIILVIVAILVSVSTALVGPVTFFGLLVANLAYTLVPSPRHRHSLAAAALIAFICLVGGQTVLERLLAFDTALSIVIEFLGGIVFLALVLKGVTR